MRNLILAAACVGLLASGPAAAQKPGSRQAQEQVLRQAGVVFPERLGVYTLLEHDNSIGGGHVGVHYASQSRSVISIYVGPAEGSLENAFRLTEQSVRDSMSDLRLIRELAAPPSAPGALGRLWSARLSIGPVNTMAMVWQRRGWRISARATASSQSGEAAIAEMEQALQAFDWD
jgi:hypothetical protein